MAALGIALLFNGCSTTDITPKSAALETEGAGVITSVSATDFCINQKMTETRPVVETQREDGSLKVHFPLYVVTPEAFENAVDSCTLEHGQQTARYKDVPKGSSITMREFTLYLSPSPR